MKKLFISIKFIKNRFNKACALAYIIKPKFFSNIIVEKKIRF